MFFEKAECFLLKKKEKKRKKKAECLANTYKSDNLIYKLPKKTIYIYIYIREFILYLNQLFNNTY